MLAICFTKSAAATLKNADGSRRSSQPTKKSIAAKVLAMVPALSRRAVMALAIAAALAASTTTAFARGGSGGLGGGGGMSRPSFSGASNANFRPISNTVRQNNPAPIFQNKPVVNNNGSIISDKNLAGKVTENKITQLKQPVNLSKSNSLTTLNKDQSKLRIVKPLKNSQLSNALKSGKFDRLANGAAGKNFELANQFQLMNKGNVARKLNLSDKLAKNGGWQKRLCGPLDPNYTKLCSGKFYCGPKWCPHHCWCPHQCGWLDWCFNFGSSGGSDGDCGGDCDPRPDFCQPVACGDADETIETAPPAVNEDTWVGDPQPEGAEAGDQIDLELVAVRLVDNGHAEKKIGPRYRIWVGNNSKQALNHPFDVAIATAEKIGEVTEGQVLPHAGKRVPAIEAGQAVAVDIRLPLAANQTVKNDAGESVAKFPMLEIVIDPRNEIEEATKENNSGAMVREKIELVDPALFAAATKEVASGKPLNLAGEGFGPEAGQAIIRVGGLELNATIEGWYDLGARIKLPELPVAGATKAELVLIRGDGAATNPLQLDLADTTQAAPAAPTE